MTRFYSKAAGCVTEAQAQGKKDARLQRTKTPAAQYTTVTCSASIFAMSPVSNQPYTQGENKSNNE
jgi:hypothetical protein